jgi:hypothetical protein
MLTHKIKRELQKTRYSRLRGNDEFLRLIEVAERQNPSIHGHLQAIKFEDARGYWGFKRHQSS